MKKYYQYILLVLTAILGILGTLTSSTSIGILQWGIISIIFIALLF